MFALSVSARDQNVVLQDLAAAQAEVNRIQSELNGKQAELNDLFGFDASGGTLSVDFTTLQLSSADIARLVELLADLKTLAASLNNANQAVNNIVAKLEAIIFAVTSPSTP